MVLSLLLFRPEVYDKFFCPDGNLNGTGEWSMLLGAIGLVSLIMINNSYSNPENGNLFQAMIKSKIFYISMLLFSVLHAAVLGFEGWLTPGEWPGGMPSFSLLSVLAFLASLILVYFQGKKQTGRNV